MVLNYKTEILVEYLAIKQDMTENESEKIFFTSISLSNELKWIEKIDVEKIFSDSFSVIT